MTPAAALTLTSTALSAAYLWLRSSSFIGTGSSSSSSRAYAPGGESPAGPMPGLDAAVREKIAEQEAQRARDAAARSAAYLDQQNAAAEAARLANQRAAAARQAAQEAQARNDAAAAQQAAAEALAQQQAAQAAAAAALQQREAAAREAQAALDAQERARMEAAAAAQQRAASLELERRAAADPAAAPYVPPPAPAPAYVPPPAPAAPAPAAPAYVPPPAAAPRPAAAPAPAAPAPMTEVERIRVGATILRDYLQRNQTAGAYGYKDHPSQPVATFQRIAKITTDGIFGPQTVQAARTVGVKLPPRPKAAGTAPAPAAPAAQQQAPIHNVAVQPSSPAAPAATLPAGYNPVQARQLASQLARHLTQLQQQGKIYDYSRPMMRSFQTAAGITPDGIYGGGTRGALLYYGAPSSIPKPAFKPLDTRPYSPPGGAVA